MPDPDRTLVPVTVGEPCARLGRVGDQRVLHRVELGQFAAGAALALFLSPFGLLTLLIAVLGGVLALGCVISGRRDANACMATNLLAVLYLGLVMAVVTPPAAAALLMLWPVMGTAYALGGRALAPASVAMLAAMTFGYAWSDAVSEQTPVQLGITALLISASAVGAAGLRRQLDTLISDLERTASLDGLTGLPNRRTFSAAFVREIERSRRGGQPLSLAMFDIDRFKAINDCFGHAEGDKALRRFSALLADQCRAFDVPGRLGGEEFALLLVGSDAQGAEAFASRLRRRLAEMPDDELMPFTASCGIAELDVHGHDPEALMLAADRALYTAKNAGRDQAVVAPRPSAGPGPVEPVEGAPAAGKAEPDALDLVAQRAEQLSSSVTLKLEPQPHAATTLGFSTLNPAPVSASTKSITEPST